MSDRGRLILTFSCPDVAGIQAAVTSYLHKQGAFLEDVASYSDLDTKTFFSRIVFSASGEHTMNGAAMRDGFADIADKFSMTWNMFDQERRCRTVIAVSKFGHCLNDLLHRWKIGALPLDIIGVISNHDAMREMTEWHGLPYHHLPVTKQTKMEQEAAFIKLVDDADADLIILARYMQILSDGLAARLSGRCINIHHSFLPSFKGAKPYHQAHKRGVKIIGATAHYVTADLDEGPIIEQGVERVDHTATPDDLVAIGRDIESNVLARAVKWQAEHRVLLNGHRTVIFK